MNSEPLNNDRQASQVKTLRKIIAMLSMFGAGSGLYVSIIALFEANMTNRIFLVHLAFFVLAFLQVVSGFFAFKDGRLSGILHVRLSQKTNLVQSDSLSLQNCPKKRKRLLKWNVKEEL